MNAMEFIQAVGIPRAKEVAERAGTTYNYFYQIASGHRNAGLHLAEALVRESEHRIDLMSLLRSTPDRKPAA